jgi:hypothetical protein
MSRTILSFTVLLLCAAVFAVLLQARQPQIIVPQAQHQQQSRRPVMPKKERQQHARLISEGLGNPGDRKISDLLDSGLTPLGRGIGTPILVPNSVGFDLNTVLRPNNCEADAIAVVYITEQYASYTADGTFIHTLNYARVSEVLKNNPQSSIRPNQSIVIDRTGGKLTDKGRPVELIDSSNRPLEKGQTYLLFMTFLPEGNYVADSRSFKLAGGQVVSLSDALDLRNLDIAKNVPEFLKAVRFAAEEQCEEGGAQ